MKKLFAILMVIAMLCSFAACAANDNTTTEAPTTAGNDVPTTGGNDVPTTGKPDDADKPNDSVKKEWVIADTVAADTAYKFGMIQEQVQNKTFYLQNEMNGFYVKTTEDITAGVDVYLEATEGGYHLYCLNGEKKTYINSASAMGQDGKSHVNATFDAEAKTVYTFDAEKKILVTEIEGNAWTLGTRSDKTYTTVGPVKVSQNGFWCRFYVEQEVKGDDTKPDDKPGNDNTGDIDPTQPPKYSSELNSGHRDVTCTTLSNTSAVEYYIGEYTYEELTKLSSTELLEALRKLMNDTHKTYTTYEDCHTEAYRTDCQDEDGTVLLWYTSYVSSMEEYINVKPNGFWNREHVWPRSRLGFHDTYAASDLHHIRPTDKSTNGKRGNEMYGYPDESKAKEVCGTAGCGNAVGGHSDNKYFEPLDNCKGDAARACLYVWVHYGAYSQAAGKCDDILNIFQSVDVLLEWMQLDPVDTWEMGRNEVVYNIQGNRNVFVDYPELAWLLFDREIPADCVTPSHN